ncbi:MAG: hypothetical protein BGO67_11890 [Alphaproteobacteria bacterium 41-28]|nr:MAG: hypothetical protein BGO67_11890 [Alphaproteobacteria bacterium 41-28]
MWWRRRNSPTIGCGGARGAATGCGGAGGTTTATGCGNNFLDCLFPFLPTEREATLLEFFRIRGEGRFTFFIARVRRFFLEDTLEALAVLFLAGRIFFALETFLATFASAGKLRRHEPKGMDKK